jgi:aryl-alcohol dehydrogenase-like predicted oxidoreductase
MDDICTSAEVLKISTIDLFLLHRDDPSVSVGEVIENLNEMVRQQKISAFGASNWSAKRIEEAQIFAGQNGLQGFCASSPHASLANWVREPWPGCVSLAGPSRRDEKKWYMERQFPVLAWSPLAGGFLADSNDTLVPGTNHPSYSSTENVEKRNRTKAIGVRRHATASQIALAYLFSQPLNLFSVVSSTRMCHLQSNIAALDITLSPGERSWLELESDGRPIGEFNAAS